MQFHNRLKQYRYYVLNLLKSKVSLSLVPLLLLPYSVNTQALSAGIAQVINGSEPYLTFDNGRTKVTTTENLLGITLSDGTAITPANNTSAITPIILPNAGESFEDIGMLIPPSVNSIALNALIGTPYNYWGDDDGDGNGVNGITATGNLSVSITDKNNQAVSRSTVLSICDAPYKMVLTSSNGSLSTEYGIPKSSNFTRSSATYYINPKSEPIICYVRPVLDRGTGYYAGPATIWNSTKGFLVQSTKPSSYGSNFPTTGSNNLYFDLLVSSSVPLTWPTVTKGGITATMTVNPPRDRYVNPDGESSVRVTLTGSAAAASQISSGSPGSISQVSLPQTFELVGYDSNHNAVVKYGFVLKQWFVNRGNKIDSVANHSSWCSSLGGYHLPQIKDLTNAVCSGPLATASCQGAVGTTPASTGNYYQRNIGAGFFSEWGLLADYTGSEYVSRFYWTSDRKDSRNNFFANPNFGNVSAWDRSHSYYGVCVYP